MSIERVTSAIVSAERIQFLQTETGVSRVEAVRIHLLDVNAGTIAGHDIYGEKNDEWVLVRDGLLRSLNLERIVRGYLFRERAETDRVDVVDEEAQSIHPKERFRYEDLIHDYNLVRQKHNEMFARHEGDTKTLIPKIDRKLAHTFLKEMVVEGRLLLDKSRSLEDIELQGLEGEPMFRFPPSEYEREKGLLEKERDELKIEAVNITTEKAIERSRITRNPGDSWIRNIDVESVFNGLKEKSSFRDELGMSWNDTSALAFLKEKVDSGTWEQIVIHNPLTDRDDIYFRPLPQEASEN